MSEEVVGTAAAQRSAWENLRDVVLEPSATFEDVAGRPRWLAPLLILAGATFVVSFFMLPLYVEMQQMALLEREMTPEQREQAATGMEAFKWIGLFIAPLAFAVLTALIALLFWGWAAVSGGRNAEYRVAFTALVYAGVIGFLQSVVQAVVVAIKGAEQVAREGGPPLFGLSLFFDRGDMPRLLWGQIANINFFSIWYAVVIGIAGVYALRMSRGSAWALAAVIFLVFGFLTAFQGGPAG
ncbi:MAG TPA: YIP1 family protein [Gemmatimonadota bacterium]|nr:YIP1 family protein [Gemmatimonadota bacterium]